MTFKKNKTKPAVIKGSNETIRLYCIRFKPTNSQLKKFKSEKRNTNNDKIHDKSLTICSKLSSPLFSSLSNWLKFLKDRGVGSMSRFNILFSIASSRISLEKAQPKDRIFIASCLDKQLPSSSPKYNLTSVSSSFNTRRNIFPLLEQATNAFFHIQNILDPFFTQAGFFGQPRSEFLRLCVWRVGLQFVPLSDLQTELRDSITKEILIRLVPSKISFSMSTLQGIAILSTGLYGPSLDKYRVYLLCCASRILNCLGLTSCSPGSLNQEQFLAFSTLRHTNSFIYDLSEMSWHDEATGFSLQNSVWPQKSYSDIGSLYVDHPNHKHSIFFCTEPHSAALDANIITLCKCSYYFTRLEHLCIVDPSLNNKLHSVLAWGAYELERSKVVQLPGQKFIPLALFSHDQSIPVISPNSNSTLSLLQLILHCRFQHTMLSESEPQYTFLLFDLIKLLPGQIIFARLPMLISAVKHLLLLSWDSKVERYLEIARNCLKKMAQTSPGQQHAQQYFLLFETLIARAKPVVAK